MNKEDENFVCLDIKLFQAAFFFLDLVTKDSFYV